MSQYSKQSGAAPCRNSFLVTLDKCGNTPAIRRRLLASSFIVLLFGASTAQAVTAVSSTLPDQDRRYAIVLLNGQPLSMATATKPVGGKKIDFQNAATRTYRAQLAAQHIAYRRWLHAHVPAALVTAEFDIALNAVAVQLNGATLAEVGAMAGVRQVSYQSLFHKMATVPTNTTVLTNTQPSQWQGQKRPWADAGSGVKVAVIDGGIDVNHPCFNDDGYAIQPHYGETRFVNNKIIAARAFSAGQGGYRYSPEPTDAHGTHISGVIACNADTTASLGAVALPEKLSGIAPRALLGNYNIFPETASTARSEDVLNAMEAAYRDGFDIVNFSLADGQRSGSGIEIRALRNLDQANMLFAVAGSKSGRIRESVDKPGSSSADANEVKDARDANQANEANEASNTLQEAPGTATTDDDAPVPLVVIRSSGAEYFAVRARFGVVPSTGLTGPLAPVLSSRTNVATNVANDVATNVGTTVAATGGIGQACLPLRRFSLTGSIALVMRGACDFTTKVRNVEAAGAIGAIVVAEEGDALIIMDTNDDAVQPTIPAFMVNLSDRPGLQANRGIATRLPPNSTDTAVGPRENMFAGFTSLMPEATEPSKVLEASGISEPSIISRSPITPTSVVENQLLSAAPSMACAAPPCFALMGGMSLASAEMAGVAATLRARYPTWSAAEVHAAMSSTASLSISRAVLQKSVSVSGALGVSSATDSERFANASIPAVSQ